jgi:hypothetical protein
MDDELTRRYRRWREAERDGREEDADAVFGGLFRSVVEPPAVRPGFTTATMAAVAAAADAQRARARRLRRVLVPAGAAACLAGAYFGAGVAGTVLSALLVGALDLLVGVVVTAAATAPAGGDVWSVLTSLGRVTAALLTNSTVTATILAIQAVALAALLALRRLLGPDGESLR